MEKAEMEADPGRSDLFRCSLEALQGRKAAAEVDRDLGDETGKTTSLPRLEAHAVVVYSILLLRIHKKTATRGNNLYSSWWTLPV